MSTPIYYLYFSGQPQRSTNKPRMLQDVHVPAPVLSPSTPSWSSSPHDAYPPFTSAPTRSFSPPPQHVQDRPSILQQHADLIATYPAPREKHAPATPPTGLIKPVGSSAPKPGAGYSYQGIVCVKFHSSIYILFSGILVYQGIFEDNVTGGDIRLKRHTVVASQGALRGPDSLPVTMCILLNVNFLCYIPRI